MKNTIIALFLILSGIADTNLSAQSANDFSYQILNNGQMTYAYIDGYSGPSYINNILIPDKLGGYPVMAIASEVFKENFHIASVTFPKYLAAIGSRAFYGCPNLRDIFFPELENRLEKLEIRTEAFANCSNLRYVRIPKNTKFNLASDWLIAFQ